MDELRALFAQVRQNQRLLNDENQRFNSFMDDIEANISVNNPISSALNADQVVAIYLPLFTEHGSRIQSAVTRVFGAPLQGPPNPDPGEADNPTP